MKMVLENILKNFETHNRIENNRFIRKYCEKQVENSIILFCRKI